MVEEPAKKTFSKNTIIPKKLFNAFIAHVANDESWKEPKKIFFSQKELSHFPFSQKKLQQLYLNTIEIKRYDVLRRFPAIQEIEKKAGNKGRKETHITLSKACWDIVKKLKDEILINKG